MIRNELKIRQRLSSVNVLAATILEYKEILMKNSSLDTKKYSRIKIAGYENQMANYAIDAAQFGARVSEIKKALQP